MGKGRLTTQYNFSLLGLQRHLPLVPLILILMALVPPNGTSQTCPAKMSHVMREAHYREEAKPNLDSSFMTSIVQSFLSLVQQNPFPKDLLVQIIEDSSLITKEETIKEVLHYEVGFLVCVAIGLLYVLLMPLVGLCLACCRCCGNCGGRMYQEQTKGLHCRRRGLFWVTVAITLILLAGNICLFANNESTKRSMEEIPDKITTSLDNLQIYLSTVPQQIESVLNESSLVVDTVSNNLNGIGVLLGIEVQAAVEGPLLPALQFVRHLSKVVTNSSGELAHLNASMGMLQPQLADLHENLTAVRDHINSTIMKPDCMACIGLQSQLNQLHVNTEFNTPGLSELQSTVDSAQETNLDSVADEGEKFLKMIPEAVTNETRITVENINRELGGIKSQVSQVTNEIPLYKLDDISKHLSTVYDNIFQYSTDAKRVETYRWIVGVVLCSLILLVVVCNLLGLFLGPLGLNPKIDPTERSRTADCGGNLLMSAVGFSFVFSWLFMLLVIILFLVGGNAYTLICKPWKTQELFQIIDTPGLIPGFNLTESVGLSTPLTVTDIYRDCSQNKSLWITLHLQEVINLNQFLNVSEFTEEIKHSFENTNISIVTVTLLSPDVVEKLESFSEQAATINLNSTIHKINAFSTFGSTLTAIAKRLDELADLQRDPEVTSELRDESTVLRSLSTDFDMTITPQLNEVNQSLERLRTISSMTNDTLQAMLQKVGTAQNFLNTNITQIIKNKSGDFLNCQLKLVTDFAEWAIEMITQELGQCGPVALAVNSAESIICKHLVESLNAFWFSLGWCAVFLVPSIIVSIKLAKYYRRMKETDIYENTFPVTSFPRAAMKTY